MVIPAHMPIVTYSLQPPAAAYDSVSLAMIYAEKATTQLQGIPMRMLPSMDQNGGS